MSSSLQSSPVNNPVSQLARMYSALEERLRWAATSNLPITIAELNETPAIKAIAKSEWQVRGIITTWSGKGFVKEVGRRDTKGLPVEYMWNLNSAPFVLGKRTQKSMIINPSTPEITKAVSNIEAAETHRYQPAAAASSGKTKQSAESDIELAFGDTLVIIGKNPATGRIRITIEQ